MLLVALTVIGGEARSISVTPGQIAAGGIVSSDDIDLTVSGTINAADLHAISTTCRSLTSLNLEKVNIAAYNGSPLASNINDFPADELGAYTLSGLQAKTLSLPASLTAIGDGALISSNIEEIIIPASVTKIGVGAFADCKKLKNVTIPATVKQIGSHAFKGCESLHKVDFNAPEVSDECFAECTGLIDVKFGAAIRKIGAEAFNGCTSLYSLNYSDLSALIAIGEGAFASTALEDVNLSNASSLKTIGPHAFAGCTDLKTVALPHSVTTLGEGVFADCTSLTLLNVPDGVNEIPALALKGAAAMKSVDKVLHEGVNSIGELAFAGLGEMNTVTLPSSLESIGSGAFEACDGLWAVIAGGLAGVPELGSDVWLGVDCPSVELQVTAETFDAFSAADQWKDFKITLYESSLPDIEADKTESADIHIVLKGGYIAVTGTKALDMIDIFDLDGRHITGINAQGATEIGRQAAVSAGKVYVVSLRFSDGTASAAKILAGN